MTQLYTSPLASQYRAVHQRALEMVQALDEAQMRWQPGPSAPGIAFHLWHLARWADYVYELLHGAGSQIWQRENLAGRWGLQPEKLGFAATGLFMDEADCAGLGLPEKGVLVDYAQRAFGRACAAVEMLSDEQFLEVRADVYGSVWQEHQLGPSILNYTVHANRHLGMIECLRGVMGLKGTATR